MPMRFHWLSVVRLLFYIQAVIGEQFSLSTSPKCITDPCAIDLITILEAILTGRQHASEITVFVWVYKWVPVKLMLGDNPAMD